MHNSICSYVLSQVELYDITAGQASKRTSECLPSVDVTKQKLKTTTDELLLRIIQVIIIARHGSELCSHDAPPFCQLDRLYCTAYF